MDNLTGRELDAAVAVALGYEGVGYYGPNKPQTMHTDYDLMPTQAAAYARYVEHWGEDHMDPDRDDTTYPELCYWEANYGPRFVPEYSAHMDGAWKIVRHLRDQWTAATAGSDGFGDFERPFDDGAFFDRLHRHADRRWPWALLYLTPEALCLAFLLSVAEEEV